MARGLHRRLRTVRVHPKGPPWRASPPTQAPSRRPCRWRPAPTRPRPPGHRTHSPTCWMHRPRRRALSRKPLPPRARTAGVPGKAARLPALATPPAPPRDQVRSTARIPPRAATTGRRPTTIGTPPGMPAPMGRLLLACPCRRLRSLRCPSRTKYRQPHRMGRLHPPTPRPRPGAMRPKDRAIARRQAPRPMPLPLHLLPRSPT